jgi:6-phosphogluconolactonase
MLYPQIIEVVPNSSSLAERAADEFVRLADKSFRVRRRFTVALAGGSTPQQMYTKLSQAHLSWDHVHLFWGDERCLSADHDDSNYHMAYEALLRSISIPSKNIHRIRGELPVEQAAQNYEEDLRLFFGTTTPRFNLILLGLGSDGHTASLFPDSPAIGEMSHWVAPVIHRVPPPPLVDRVTLTLPVLNAAAHILFLVSGGEKAARLAQVLQGPFQPDLVPAQAV